MFATNNRIIIVDDDKQQLLDLAEAFLANGIGCKTILYNPTYNSPMTGVRIAFFDISLTGKMINLDQEIFDYKTDKNLSAVFNDLAFAIQNCVSSYNGPYALIFWSKHTKAFPNFIEYVNERYPELPSPIQIDAMNKTDFIGKTPEEIQRKIVQIFQGKSINLLFEFEQKCEIVASQTTNEIYNIIPTNQNIGSNKWASSEGFEENFDLIFSSIAKSTLGYEYAKKNPDRGVMEALLPIMNYRLITDSIYCKDWENHLKSLKSEEINYPEKFIKGKLNSIFHLDTKSNIDTSIRGAVYKYNLVPLPFKIEYYFGLSGYFRKLETYIAEYFFNLNIDTPDEIKDLIKTKSCFIVIEISSSCDYSQNKKRNNKYLLGLKTPKFDRKQYLNLKTINNSIFYNEIPEFALELEEFFIWINFNFVISNISKIKKFGEPLFILKKELVDLIGNRYANHTSRIGITSF